MMRIRSVVVGWIAVVLASAGVAGAQETPSAQAQAPQSQTIEDAATRFRRGLDRFAQRDYAGAIAIWEELLGELGEGSGWKVLYNLGLAYEAVGDATRAIERFDAFVHRVAEKPETATADLEDRRQDAAERSRALKATHGAVVVRASSDGRVIATRIDDLPPRRAGYTVYLRPGDHVLEVRPGTARARTTRIRVAAGQEIGVDAGELAGPDPTPPTREGVPRAKRAPTTFVLVGAGLTIASFALPIALAARARSKRDAADALGTGNTRYAAARDDFNSARTAYEISYLLPAVLGAATAVVWGFVRVDPTADVRVGFSPVGGGGAVWAGGRF